MNVEDALVQMAIEDAEAALRELAGS